MTVSTMEKPSFLNEIPPPGYIAGVGRGAVGFSTRGTNGERKVPARLNKNGTGEDVTQSAGLNKRQFESIENEFIDESYEEEAEMVYQRIEDRLRKRKTKKKIKVKNNHLANSTKDGEDNNSLNFIDLTKILLVP